MTSPQFDAIRRFLAANPTPPGIPLADIRALEKTENIVLVMQEGKVVKDLRP